MHIAVVGAGRMGLPLACLMADRGAHVTACDVNASLVETINAGIAPYEEPHLSEHLERTVSAGRLRATTDTAAAVRESEAVVVIVPAWLTDKMEIDYSVLKAASAAIGKGLQPGTLVSYETTVSVGGTRSVLIPYLEEHSGLQAGADFMVSFSPERVKTNLVFARLRETPKVVGGMDPVSAAAAENLYATYLGAPVINVETLESAEFTKLAGMIYRDVNIALANELATFSEIMGVDFSLVQKAANTNGEAHLLTAGIGAGGHCTPVYPWFVIQEAERRGLKQYLPKTARHINDSQPAGQVARLAGLLGDVKDRRIHILGLGFRPDVKVDTLSPAYALRDAIEELGARPTIEDPYYTEEEVRNKGFALGTVGDDCAAIILNTAHAEYADADFESWKALGVGAVLDGRRLWDPAKVEAAGIIYVGVGRPVCDETVAAFQQSADALPASRRDDRRSSH